MMSIQKPIGMTIVRFGLLILATAVALVAHGAAPQPAVGDFSQIVGSRTGKLTVWRYADNPSFFVFVFPGLAYQGRSFNRITQFTEQQITEPYPRVLNEQEMAARLAAAR